MSRGSCKRCGAEVDWHETRKGKTMPLDPEPVDRRTVVRGQPGNAVVRDGIVHVLGPGRSVEPGEELRIPHFDSCPHYQHGARGRQDAVDRAHQELDAEAEARAERDNGFEKAVREAGRPKPEQIAAKVKKREHQEREEVGRRLAELRGRDTMVEAFRRAFGWTDEEGT